MKKAKSSVEGNKSTRREKNKIKALRWIVQTAMEESSAEKSRRRSRKERRTVGKS